MVTIPIYTQTKKEGSKKQPPKIYDPRLKVNGTFLDLMKATVKDAKSKDKKKP